MDEMEEEEERNNEVSYVCGPAASGRSACRGCGSNIANRSLRVGEETEDEYNHRITRWYHPNCITLNSGTSANQISGYSSLSKDNKKIIEDLCSKSGGGGVSSAFSITPEKKAAAPKLKSSPKVAASTPFDFGSFPSTINLKEDEKKKGKVLDGLVFVIANGSEENPALVQRIVENSGRVIPNVDYTVTHVISTHDQVNPKFAKPAGVRSAIARRIPVVSEQFVNEAISHSRVPENERHQLVSQIAQPNLKRR
eukprot:TRINITY_DN8850_c0_g1_i1.p1 TRINITY_DN8850_c0_g1~~TRINITY_DN8850_c0_g1_i1.p1  ORF type:complete len:291 (+),score=106.46 TRINITY_DN8850_c0_g1_i1:116-874(+)